MPIAPTKKLQPMYDRKNQIDSRALRALLQFDPRAEGRFAPESTGGLSADEFAHATSHGALFTPNIMAMTHDEAVRDIRAAAAKTSARDQANCFLAGLSAARPDYRSGLPAFAVATNFPDHSFSVRPNSPYCLVCGMEQANNEVFRNSTNRERFSAGGIVGTQVPELAFSLTLQLQLRPVEPEPADLDIFHRILAVLSDVPAEENAKKDVLKKVRAIKGLKCDKFQAQIILETLGYCGILETPEHPGFLDRYTNLGNAPRSSRSSDWKYPVDFWRGKYGLNKRALKFWFGHHKKVGAFS